MNGDDDYNPGEFSGLDEPDYDPEQAERDIAEHRKADPEFDALMRSIGYDESPTVAEENQVRLEGEEQAGDLEKPAQ
jgi:hypothetical protein